MKALVVEIKGKDATLLQDNGQFMTIKNRHYLVGEEVIMNKNSLQKRGLAMAAAAAVFIMLITTGVFAYVTPYYHVSLDVNPGFTMEVNRFERVIGLEYLNGEAEDIINDLDWKNKDIELVISDTVKLLEQKGYFDEAGEILIAAAGKSDVKALVLADKLAATTGELGINNAEVSSQAVGYEMVQAAKESGMTPGRYNIITRLLGETENVDAYKDYSIRELMSQFTESKGAMGQDIASAARERSQDTDKDEGEQAANQGAADVRQDNNNNQEAADARQDNYQEAADARQDAESTVTQASQAEAETKQEAEQTVDEATQNATDMIQEAEEAVNDAIQTATEAVDEAVETVDEATQPATEALKTTQEPQPETTENENQVETDDVVPETTTRR